MRPQSEFMPFGGAMPLLVVIFRATKPQLSTSSGPIKPKGQIVPTESRATHDRPSRHSFGERLAPPVVHYSSSAPGLLYPLGSLWAMPL
jgi:hypothetical protein